MRIPLKLVDELKGNNSFIPTYAIEDDAGLDLCSREDFSIEANSTHPAPTGIIIEIPRGYFAMVVPRSGLSKKYGITIVNSPGIIDSNYRGEIIVLLHNLGKKTFTINKGDRIAQILILKHESIVFELTNKLSDTDRGNCGFGSTGV